MKQLIVLLSALTLASCAATPQIAPAGVFQTESNFSVTLADNWSQWAAEINRTSAGEVLTQDGFLLNRLHFMTLNNGESLINYYNQSGVPFFRSDATESEIVDLVTASLLVMGYYSVEAEDVRPARLSGMDGIRFNLSGKWSNGLNVKGDVAAVVSNGQLNLILFIAPELHYYDALSDDVDAIMASMVLGG